MHDHHRLPPTTLAIALGLAVVAQACAVRSPCCAGRPHFPHPPRTLQVEGVGEVQIAPDIARTSLGVEARAPSAQEAADAANGQMQKVIDALRGAGVAKEDLQTHNLSLFFEHARRPRPPSGDLEAAASNEPEGQYVARNTVEVTLRDLDSAPAVIAAATSAGANEMHGLQFEVEDRTPHQDEARELAVRDAQAHAKQLAELSGVKLGEVRAIFDGGQPGGPGVPAMGMRTMAESAAPPIERGQLTVRHTVTLVIALEE